MWWLIPAPEKIFNAIALILVSAFLGAGCSANPPEADGRGQAAEASGSRGVAVALDNAVDVPHVYAPHAEQAVNAGVAPAWVALRTFTFDYDNASIGSADVNKAAEISQYVGGNPALRIVIDGSVSPRGIDAHNPGLRDRRVEVVREALIAAGVSPYIIETGAFGNERAMGDLSVEVLVKKTGE